MTTTETVIEKYIPASKKVKSVITIDPDGTFGAINKAKEMLRESGYSIGSMCREKPIAIAKGEDRYISKWHNLGEDIGRIEGFIVTDSSFREGNATIVIFEE